MCDVDLGHVAMNNKEKTALSPFKYHEMYGDNMHGVMVWVHDLIKFYWYFCDLVFIPFLKIECDISLVNPIFETIYLDLTFLDFDTS